MAGAGLAPGGFGGAALFASSAAEPGTSDWRPLAEQALALAKKLGASYADIRIEHGRTQSVTLRDRTESGGGESESGGFGIRTMVRGAWGFASSPRVTPEEVERITRLAVEIAKASAMTLQSPIRLAPVPAYKDSWKSPLIKDPFQVSRDDKLELLTRMNEKALAVQHVFRVNSSMNFARRRWFFASSEGSRIEQQICRTSAGYTVIAIRDRVSKSRTFDYPPRNAGYELIEKPVLLDHVERVAEEAVEHTTAPQGPVGKKDLILSPSHLYLTLHESVAHPTELDRVMGWEANYAGTSFLTADQVGKLQWGSPLLNVVADRTVEGGLATVGYDDDGVKGQRWRLIREGKFVGFQTTRDTAQLIGEKESRGCSTAVSWYNMPILRMANVHVEPGPAGSPTPEEIMADTQDGILIDGRGSYSIDQQRYNFQFGGDAFWEIKNGKKVRMLDGVTYYAINTDFWNAADAISGPEHWELYGTGGDAKGEPVQSQSISHGCPWMRFRNISVGGAQS